MIFELKLEVIEDLKCKIKLNYSFRLIKINYNLIRYEISLNFPHPHAHDGDIGIIRNLAACLKT